MPVDRPAAVSNRIGIAARKIPRKRRSCERRFRRRSGSHLRHLDPPRPTHAARPLAKCPSGSEIIRTCGGGLVGRSTASSPEASRGSSRGSTARAAQRRGRPAPRRHRPPAAPGMTGKTSRDSSGGSARHSVAVRAAMTTSPSSRRRAPANTRVDGDHPEERVRVYRARLSRKEWRTASAAGPIPWSTADPRSSGRMKRSATAARKTVIQSRQYVGMREEESRDRGEYGRSESLRTFTL